MSGVITRSRHAADFAIKLEVRRVFMPLKRSFPSGLRSIGSSSHGEGSDCFVIPQTLQVVVPPGGTRVALALHHGGRIRLQVRDNGRGFDRATGKKPKHLGLVSMTERAAIVGGEIDVASERGKGTIVSVRIPLRGKPK